MAAGISDLIGKYIPEVSVTVEAAGGTPMAGRLLRQGQVHLSMLSDTAILDSQLGIRIHKDDPYPMRVLFYGHSSIFHLVTLADSGIETIWDMGGKTYAFDKPGSSNRDFGYALLHAAFIEPPVEVRPWVGTKGSIQMVADGVVDVSQSSAIGSAPFRELFLTRDARLITIPEDILAEMVENFPGYSLDIIPEGYYETGGGGTYPPEDWPSIGMRTALVTVPDFPESLAYEIAKAVLGHPEEMATYHSESHKYSLERGVQIPFTPYHDGAIKYFKEKGVWTDDLQELQDELLAEQEQVLALAKS